MSLQAEPQHEISLKAITDLIGTDTHAEHIISEAELDTLAAAVVRWQRAKRFWEQVLRPSPDACWVWTGFINPDSGYGQGFRDYAHRMAWRLTNGPEPTGMHILHRCDNRPCCNPTHLFVGTHIDNMRDMREKGRSNSGERNGSATLTEAIVRSIRSSPLSNRELASKYGVHRTTIGQIRRRERWGTLEDDS